MSPSDLITFQAALHLFFWRHVTFISIFFSLFYFILLFSLNINPKFLPAAEYVVPLLVKLVHKTFTVKLISQKTLDRVGRSVVSQHFIRNNVGYFPQIQVLIMFFKFGKTRSKDWLILSY